MSSLGILNDQDLLDVYFKAKKIKLEPLFIDTLLIEIERRGLDVFVG
jgi:hypothetical protein